MNTKKDIVQYLGQQFSTDVCVALESGIMSVVPVQNDPADDQEDDKDAAGNTINTTKEKVKYVDNKTFEKNC